MAHDRSVSRLTRTFPPPLPGALLRFKYDERTGRILIDIAQNASASLINGDKVLIGNLPGRFSRAWRLPYGNVLGTFRVTEGRCVFEVVFRVGEDSDYPHNVYRYIPLRQMSGKAQFTVVELASRETDQRIRGAARARGLEIYSMRHGRSEDIYV